MALQVSLENEKADYLTWGLPIAQLGEHHS